MKTYLADPGAALLQSSLQSGIPLNITGAQVGSAYGFAPTTAMTTAQGTLLVDNKANPAGVLTTPIHVHEAIYSVRLDQTQEFAQVGNILLFLEGQPFLWNVSEVPFGKLKTNPITHFAGDEYYFSSVMRYPYLRSLIAFDGVHSWHAEFPVYDHIYDVVAPEHAPNDQIFVEQNSLWFGKNNPFFASRLDGHWYASPLINPVGPGMTVIDGGGTLSGY